MDPLSALRDFTIRGELQKIVRVNDEYRFGTEYTFQSSIKTAYRSKQGDLYTVETLVYFIQNTHVKHTDYLQNARAAGIPAVTFIDRKPLSDYLAGKLTSSDNVVFPPPPFHNDSLASAPNPSVNSSGEYLPKETAIYDPSGAAEDIGVAGGYGFAADGEETENNVDLMSMIRAAEKPLRDREMLLQCKNKDFYNLLLASTKRDEERQRIESLQRKDGLMVKNRLIGMEERGSYGDELGYDFGSKTKIHLKGGKIGEGVPIILVPSAFQTLITIFNVKEFLEDGVFVPTDVKVKQVGGAKPECVTVQKKFGTDRNRIMTAYEVRDKPSSLKPEDWDRVVSVFVLGKEWQFKDWPFKDHVEIFNKIIGFYMRFEDDSVESAKNVKQWNVKIISISKNKRHQDRAAALEVWDKLEAFMRSRAHS